MLAPDTLLQNRYLVVRPIGKGGMGAVYLAKDQRLRSTVALKETFFEDEHLRKAFEREAALLANLRHSALPRVIDHFNEDQGQFLVMEFIPGEDLEEMFKSRGGAFSQTEVLGWADQLLDAQHGALVDVEVGIDRVHRYDVRKCRAADAAHLN